MDLTQLLGEFGKFKKDIDITFNLLKEISRLEQNRIRNLPQLKIRLSSLDRVINQLNLGEAQSEVLRKWVEEYKQELLNSQEQLKEHFGNELEQELKRLGLSLSGHYPDLKAGFFTIEADFDKERVIIWYGPKHERLDQCHLLPSEVVNRLEKIRQQLGSRLDEAQFLKKMMEAYSRITRITGSKRGEPAPIISILAELAYLLQSPQFRQDPRKENYKGYNRADFSYDLFRIHRSKQPTLFNKGLHLIVATRSYTRQRQYFLWVPDDESGKGTDYSHLQFKEAT